MCKLNQFFQSRWNEVNLGLVMDKHKFVESKIFNVNETNFYCLETCKIFRLQGNE
jgi:hypothetical protein